MTNITDTTEVEDTNLPDEDSFNVLREDFNAAITKFAAKNSNVPVNMVMPSILHTMFLFPFEWLRQTNNENQFLNAINSEARYFFSSLVGNSSQTESVDSEENAGASEGLQ